MAKRSYTIVHMLMCMRGGDMDVLGKGSHLHNRGHRKVKERKNGARDSPSRELRSASREIPRPNTRTHPFGVEKFPPSPITHLGCASECRVRDGVCEHVCICGERGLILRHTWKGMSGGLLATGQES
jgi:hypothetical protein